ncbi:permease family-domain-containing protein [Protomyces lactucae-debilis]|uniref:Permease family-domain-containing protein n=1 Tax=Protomyces lactucae-debilis TaxID=2754530 RepID=A0A1Y2FUQ3_PROLT|nr:permease family-domain-containing protein [Protomyces lactucae-debilis]ORY87014.1 permease family-domain-containing protein [Protomyces lactucae-debilis]
MARWMDSLNRSVARSFVGRYFRLSGSGHALSREGSLFTTELRAGLTTFAAMAYIISVNSTILTDSGATCVCESTAADPICVTNEAYAACLQIVRRDFVTGTAAIAALTTVCMGLFANMPIALAPGMGLNAYFTYNVVGFHGTGPVSYKLALTAVFVEGFIFVALSLLGLRQWLARAIPASIKLASGVGIGLYLALIGMGYSAGIGVVTGATATPLELAGCLESDLVDGVCPSFSKMRNPRLWIAVFCGGFLTVMLMLYRIKGAIIAGILLVSAISWPRSTSFSAFPHTPLGDSNFDFFKKVVSFHGIEKTLLQQEWNLGGAGGQFALALITFLYVDILDCTGTLYSMARFSGAIDERTQDFEGSATAYLVDAFGISIGSLFGLSPVTAFIESASGISEGGKTGLTAVTTGICFLISCVAFAPIFSSIPPWATGCTLIIVGALMSKSAAQINWKYMGDAIPAFLTLAVMPFTYSIAYGLIAGIVSYAVINTLVWVLEKVSGGRITPPGKEDKEPWTYKIEGGVLPPWLTRAVRGQRDFWVDHDQLAKAKHVREEPGSNESMFRHQHEMDSYDGKAAAVLTGAELTMPDAGSNSSHSTKKATDIV